jgi:hypothetical protein
MQDDRVGAALDVFRQVYPDGVTALRRVGSRQLDDLVRARLGAGAPDLLTLWRATAVRPLETAIADLDPSLRRQDSQLHLLLDDGLMPALPRRLSRIPEIARARRIELMTRQIRRAVGRLARAGDPVLAPLVPRQADTGLLCALVLAVSTAAIAPVSSLTRLTGRGDVAVPGFPASTLDDDVGPWRLATSDATELGAQLSWQRPAPALLVPTAWLGRGGWPALWARAATKSRRQQVTVGVVP